MPREVERFDPQSPHANKLRIFELAEALDFDILVSLDCDIGVMGDIAPYLSRDHIRARIQDGSQTLADEEWKWLFAEVGLEVGKDVVDPRGQRVWPYYNTGVVFVPRELCRPLLEHWTAALDRVSWLKEKRPSLPVRWYAEQIAFAIAVQSGGFDLDALPLNLNYSINGDPSALLPDLPVILHYHRFVDRWGFPRRSTDRGIDQQIELLNRERAERLGVRYHGLSRWPFEKRMREGSRLTNRLWTWGSKIKAALT
jgi:hypothetical protein